MGASLQRSRNIEIKFTIVIFSLKQSHICTHRIYGNIKS